MCQSYCTTYSSLEMSLMLGKLKDSHGSAGFSLIEILVVISILAVIAGIVFPIFTEVKRKAQETTCLSNLKQLGTAMRLYANDWDGRLPAARIFEGGEHNMYGNWAGCDIYGGKCDPQKGQLYNCVKNLSVYHCPSVSDGDMKNISGDAKPYPLSYSMNGMLSYKLMSGVWSPAKVGLLIHEAPNSMDDGDFNWMGLAGHPEEGWNQPAKVHRGGTCLIYCDLHAVWRSRDDILDELQEDDWNPGKVERGEQ